MTQQTVMLHLTETKNIEVGLADFFGPPVKYDADANSRVILWATINSALEEMQSQAPGTMSLILTLAR